MKKVTIIFLLWLLIACSKNDAFHNIWISNTQNDKIYLEFDGWKNISQRKLVFIQHGLASNLLHSVVQTAKKAFLDKGYFVVTFDSRYSLGKSDGKVEEVSLSTFVDDLTTVINWAKKQKFYSEPFALAGHSLGGASVFQYAAQNPQQVNVLVPITPVVSGDLWEKTCMKNMPEFCKNWQQTGFYEYKTAERTAVIPYQLVEETKAYSALELASEIKAQTLLVSAENDSVVQPADVSNLSEKLQTHASFIMIPNSSHNFETMHNQIDLYEAIYSFLK